MSLAAVDLQSERMKIIDVAGKYGYNSPTAFNRAFQSVHKIAPSAVKNGGVSVKSFPPISFRITVKGVEEMNYRIETKEAFRIAGVCVPLNKDIEKNFSVIPSKWQEASSDGTLQRLVQMMDQPPMGVLGVSLCNDTQSWRYYIAVATSQEKAVLKNTWFLLRHGLYFLEKERTSPFRNWNGGSLLNGCRHPDTNMRMLRMWKCI